MSLEIRQAQRAELAAMAPGLGQEVVSDDGRTSRKRKSRDHDDADANDRPKKKFAVFRRTENIHKSFSKLIVKVRRAESVFWARSIAAVRARSLSV